MIKLNKYKIMYNPVPKCGCTTLKHAMYFLQTGVDKSVEDKNHVHLFYESSKFFMPDEEIMSDDWFRFCVVRDPVKRFISCYTNRVVLHKDQKKGNGNQIIKKYNLPQEPSFAEFLDRYEQYSGIIEIKHHSDLLSYFLGSAPEIYSEIYDLSQIDSHIIPQLETFTNLTIKKHRYQLSKTKIEVSDLSDSQIKKIKSMYEEDYDLYGKWFK